MTTTDKEPWEGAAEVATVADEDNLDDDSLDDILDTKPSISASRAQVRERLYALKGPPVKLQREPPKVADGALVMLREHVRLLKGKSPRLVRKRKLVCWMDSPPVRPKLNHTHQARFDHIKAKMEDRKDSEEDPFSSRCAQ